MQFNSSRLKQALGAGLGSTDCRTKAQADNIMLEQGVSALRQDRFETFPAAVSGSGWTDLAKRHSDYVRRYIKTGVDQPHTFDDKLDPNGVPTLDEAQWIVRLESLARPLKAFGCSLAELSRAYDQGDTPLLEAFCVTWNDSRDHRPAFSTLLSEVTDELAAADWADSLRDKLGLAHYSPMADPEPVALCRYSVADIYSEAQTGFPITMPTVLDSDPWEHYFPAPKSLGFGRAMALTLCETDEDLKVEFLNSRVTYRPEHIWRIGEIRTTAPASDLAVLRERHLLALQIAANDETFGA